MQKPGSLDRAHDDVQRGMETAMEANRQAIGALSVRAYKEKVFYEAKWRDATKT